MAQAKADHYWPEPFPDNVPVIELESISLEKLINQDSEESSRLFRICTNLGFCYLDLTTHEKGLELINYAHSLHDVAQTVFLDTPMEVKKEFKTRSAGRLDTGYRELGVDRDGIPNRVEILNISQTGLFSGTEPYMLPSWLKGHEALFRSSIRTANVVHNVILSVLEKMLELPTGAFTSIHKLTDRSEAFLRLLRYPANNKDRPEDVPLTPAHRDCVSVALLFNWLGGFQITRSTADIDHTADEPEENWHYIPPKPGHVVMNLGDALTILTNGLLKSGKHRVVAPPGKQAEFDRYCVLLSGRPQEDTIMRTLDSPLIPRGEYLKGDTMTTKEWSVYEVLKTVNKMRRQNGQPLDENQEGRVA
ncbi:hypothetical protein F5884DRAFT_778492 [Xylogone sp. PMI_703]|nr:hypothetical protein F5884DRAFT_778492 [Xylogone sp. PMI_703]